jgi:hypothetical protein
MEEYGYARVLMSKELLDDLYRMQVIHAVFSGVEILSITNIYDLSTSTKPVTDKDIKYVEYFCKSRHFYMGEETEITRSRSPYFSFKFESISAEKSDEPYFRKTMGLKWFETEEKTLEGIKCLIKV